MILAILKILLVLIILAVSAFLYSFAYKPSQVMKKLRGQKGLQFINNGGHWLKGNVGDLQNERRTGRNGFFILVRMIMDSASDGFEMGVVRFGNRFRIGGATPELAE